MNKETGNNILKGGASQYDIIAFDMDQTMAEYKLGNFMRTNFRVIAQALINELGYPHELYPTDEEEAEWPLLNFYIRGCIDKNTLNVLKISDDLHVLTVYNGYKKLTSEEILAEYGQEAKLPTEGFKERFHMVPEFFEAQTLFLTIRIKELRNRGFKNEFLDSKSIDEIIRDWKAQTAWVGNDWHKEECRLRGYLFPQLYSYPHNYLKKLTAELRTALKKLREKGKLVCLMTNSHYGYTKILMDYISHDKDWFECFDFITVYCRKPGFFNNPEQEIFELDLENKETSVKKVEDQANFDFENNKIWVTGNIHRFEEYVKKKLGKEEVKGLYFGDNPGHDMVARFLPNWDCAFIYAELGELTGEWDSKQHFDVGKTWGSHLFGLTVDGQVKKSYFFGKASQEFDLTFNAVSSAQCVDFLSR